MDALTGDMAFRALLMFMVFASVAGFVAGAALIVHPEWLTRASHYANRWVSTRRLDRSLEKWVSIDQWFYQHHRAAGVVLLAGAVWVIVFFITSFDEQSLAGELSLGHRIPEQAAEAALDAFVLVSLAGAVFAALVSLFLIARPAMLRDLGQDANRWLSLRKVLKPVEIPRSEVDEYVFRNVRVAGVLLLLGGIYILAGLLLSLR